MRLPWHRLLLLLEVGLLPLYHQASTMHFKVSRLDRLLTLQVLLRLGFPLHQAVFLLRRLDCQLCRLDCQPRLLYCQLYRPGFRLSHLEYRPYRLGFQLSLLAFPLSQVASRLSAPVFLYQVLEFRTSLCQVVLQKRKMSRLMPRQRRRRDNCQAWVALQAALHRIPSVVLAVVQRAH